MGLNLRILIKVNLPFLINIGITLKYAVQTKVSTMNVSDPDLHPSFYTPGVFNFVCQYCFTLFKKAP